MERLGKPRHRRAGRRRKGAGGDRIKSRSVTVWFHCGILRLRCAPLRM